MSHLDDEALAALAVGDDLDSDAARHVVMCADCAAKVEHMSQLARRIGALGRPAPLLTPSASVWDAISREIGDVSSDAEPAPTNLADRRAEREQKLNERPERSRRSPWFVGMAAAAAGIVAGAFIVGGMQYFSDPAGEVVAQTALTDLATEADAGTARVEVRSDGTEVLVLDTEFTAVPDAYLEVWLIDPNIEGMVSLGHLTQESEQFVIPDGFDIAEFPIVDISVEPIDGVPTHSGDSVTRGILEA